MLIGAALMWAAVRFGVEVSAGLDPRPVLLRKGDRLATRRPRWDGTAGWDNVEMKVMGSDRAENGAVILHQEELTRRRA